MNFPLAQPGIISRGENSSASLIQMSMDDDGRTKDTGRLVTKETIPRGNKKNTTQLLLK